jgi:hypothetical protein
MEMPIDYNDARRILEESFPSAEDDVLRGDYPSISERINANFDILFSSTTQAYREVLLGCTVAHIQDSNINMRLPYVDQGPDAFSGRSLDERVINPFLHDKRIPCSRGPYLSVFRRSVQFDSSIRAGLRDKAAYDSFLSLLTYLESTNDIPSLGTFLHYVLFRFALLREASNVQLSRLQRMSLEQYSTLISNLLVTPSGGRFPVLLVAATFIVIKEYFSLNWDITWQGINVADIPSGVVGDITITSSGTILMAAEVTERPIDRSRVVATFNTKIAPTGIEDYLFFTRISGVDPEAKQQAHQYFAQGHEVNFLEIKEWILTTLATIGKSGRASFNNILINLLDSTEVPRTLKVAWNEQVASLVT